MRTLLFVLSLMAGQPEVQPAEKLEPTQLYHNLLLSVETQQPELEVTPTVGPVKVPKPIPKPDPQPAKPEGAKATYTVTAYTVGDDFTPSHGVTASGEKVKAGRTVACPRSLAFGTEIYIPSLDHTYVCTDRGGRIKAGKLDIYMESRQEALEFGRKKLTIFIKKDEKSKFHPGT